MTGWLKKIVEDAARHNGYLIYARAVGVSRDVALAELESAVAEVCDPCRPVSGDPYEVARRRLVGGGPAYRPSDEVWDALRRAFPDAHPERIDGLARLVAPGETLAKQWEVP